MTYRNADTAPKPGETLTIDGMDFTVVEGVTDFPLQFRNADTRIREAFDNLSQTLINVFGSEMGQPMWEIINVLDRLEDEVHDFAKLPADA